ncbi:MAG TPA: methylated-DNA--[protein]-cysteine S-methyltransferase [Acidimicrobiales bacterium]|nr:methylated-DNA--[protein]-cysteine S-methyltransferase [Acidimicrobiales bacterium]
MTASTVERVTELQVAWGTLESPLGQLLVAVTSRGLVRVSFEANDPAAVLEVLARRISPRVMEAPALVDEPRRQLDEYLAGRRKRFDLAVDWALVSPFGREVLGACAAIPFGQVSTYGALSAAIGRPRASRATGNALGANPIPIVVPCHRVLRTGGGLGGYTGGLHLKAHLLHLEGVLS